MPSPALTAIDAASDGLLALLGLRPLIGALGAAGLTLGQPPGGPLDTAVWVSGVVDAWAIAEVDLEGAALEEFDLHLVVQVLAVEAAWAPVRDRLFALVRDAGAAVAADRTLGGAVQRAWVAGGAIEEEAEEARRGRAEVLVRCRAFPAD